MEVVGQFNNSFIVCRLGDDLYILDQHACNEKYNYEQLMNDTRINGQRLIQSNWIRPSIVDPSRWNCRLTRSMSSFTIQTPSRTTDSR